MAIDLKVLKQILSTGAKEFGIELSESQIDSCFLYVTELKKWNRKINLTAIRNDRDIIIKHFLDSFSFVKGLSPTPGLKLLDMGSGAGFPAIALKIAFPELAVTMAESVKKKASFLRHIARILKLVGAEVVDKRTEELPDSFRLRYDVVTARAFADMETALKAGFRFLKPDGIIVLGRGPAEEISEDKAATLGFRVEKRISLTLPCSNESRAVWSFRKS